jgi:hypothetical protein
MLAPYSHAEDTDRMAGESSGKKSIDWDALELQAFNLKFSRMSPEDRVRHAEILAATFRKHGEFLPNSLADVLRGKKSAPQPARRSQGHVIRRRAR